MQLIDLKKIKSIHFTGIKGVGMTALALCAKDLGIKVTGSDIKEQFVTDAVLEKANIKWHEGFSSKHVGMVDLLIYTAAHNGKNNVEVEYAIKNRIAVISHGEAVGLFMKGKFGISVGGVGGKTTTSAMMVTILELAKYNPSWAIGAGSINQKSAPGHYDIAGLHFIAEADEYGNSPQDKTPKFLYQQPRAMIITNIEYDHPDVYKNLDETFNAFKLFIRKLPKDGLLIANIDSINIQKTLREVQVPVQTYGFSSKANWQIVSTSQKNKKLIFSVKYHNQIIDNLVLKVPGEFNIKNAVAAMAVANYCGIGIEQIKNGLSCFSGTKRRFEYINSINGIDLYDDYAHHPAEIKATLEASKLWFPKRRIIVIFQPHTYSRTKKLLPDFATSFASADIAIILPIYASARETNKLGISSKILVEEIAKYNNNVHFANDKKALVQIINDKVQSGDVVMTMGAGDIFTWHDVIIKSLKLRVKK